MPRLICQILGRHRPAIIVVGFDDGRPVAAPVCPHCGRRQHGVV